MNAQALTNLPAGSFAGSRSVPALLAAVAATAVAVSIAVVVIDEGTDVAPVAPPITDVSNPMQGYVDTLIERNRRYKATLPTLPE